MDSAQEPKRNSEAADIRYSQDGRSKALGSVCLKKAILPGKNPPWVVQWG